MSKKYLFGQPYDTLNLRFGIAPGSHVTRLLKPNEKGIDIIATTYIRAPYSEITRQEVYSSASDLKNRDSFIALGKKIAGAYEDPNCGSRFKDVLISIKDYLMADSPRAQQNCLHRMYTMINDYNKYVESETASLAPKVLRSQKKADKYNTLLANNRFLLGIQRDLQRTQNGDLNMQFQIQDRLKSQKIQEPKGIHWYYDKAGIWQRSYGVLFPHEPSPNDIKQGTGVQDCFFLSALTQMAATRPADIKKAMRDNGDGTVTVRFFDKDNGNKPVYVMVNKTVNQTITGQNFYAASSLWVQMMEKAFVEFNRIRSTSISGHNKAETRAGYESINTSNTSEVMNALSEDQYISSAARTPLTLDMKEYLCQKRRGVQKGKQPIAEPPFPEGFYPDKYLPEEEKLFNILEKAVNQNKEVITVGNPDDNTLTDIGIRPRHAYTVRGLVKRKNENGKDIYFVQLRDPYGSFKPGYDKNGRLVNHSERVKGYLHAGTDTMGNFELEFRDFQTIFTEFVGIKKTTMEEICNQKWKRYDAVKDPDKERSVNIEDYVRYPAELDPVDPLPWKTLHEQEMYSILSDPDRLSTLTKRLKSAYKDIRATDEFYIATNTKPFTDMRDTLKEINKMLEKKTADGIIKSAADRELLASRLTQLCIYTSYYVDAKTSQIETNLHADKTPSIRAQHRLASAISLENVLTFMNPLSKTNNKKRDQITMMKGDIQTQLQMIERGKEWEKQEGFDQKNLNDEELQQYQQYEKFKGLPESVQNKHLSRLKKAFDTLTAVQQPGAQKANKNANIINNLIEKDQNNDWVVENPEEVKENNIPKEDKNTSKEDKKTKSQNDFDFEMLF